MKAVFFDWDGTLVDSIPFLFKAHNYVREQMGYPLWTFEEYQKALVFSTREIYPTIYKERSDEAIRMVYQYIHDHHLDNITLMDGGEDVLKFLQAEGVPIGLVSNKRHDVVRREVEHLGWQKYFGVYNGAGAASEDKPSGVPLLYALTQHPARPSIEDVIYVGDTESDLSCAAQAGCPVIFIRHMPHRNDLIEKYKPDYVVDNTAELKGALMEFLALPVKKKA